MLKSFFKQNPHVSPKFASEILRVIIGHKFVESPMPNIIKVIKYGIKYFNKEDCLSCFESLCRAKKYGEIETRDALQLLVTRIDLLKGTLSVKEVKILRKVCNETGYRNRTMDIILEQS